MNEPTASQREQIEAWDSRRRRIDEIQGAARLLEEMASSAEEDASDHEFDVAMSLLATGPVVLGARRYRFELRDGCPCVRVDADWPSGEAVPC